MVEGVKNWKTLLIVVLFITAFAFSNAFIIGIQLSPMHTRSTLRLGDISVKIQSPSLSLIRRGKRDMFDKIRKDMDEKGSDHFITTFLRNGSYPEGILRPLDLHLQLRIPGNGVSIIVEYTKNAKTGFVIDMPPPEIMGLVSRDAGGKAMVASMDSRLGGVSPEEFERLIRDQARSVSLFPGSLPVIWNDLVIDKLQVEIAAALGGAGITLQPNLVNNLTDFVAYSKKLKIEPMVFVQNRDDIAIAIASGATVLIFHGLVDAEFVKLKKWTHAKYGDTHPHLLYVARLKDLSNLTTDAEIDLSWWLREEGFHSVWPSPEVIYNSGLTDFYSIIFALKAKASRKFISPYQFLINKPKEGATEYLGDILY